MYFCVYILKSEKTNGYYIGSTNNIERRIREHNKGKSRYTKGKGPWIILYREGFNSLREARLREQQIKSWKKRVAIEKLINLAPSSNGLGQ